MFSLTPDLHPGSNSRETTERLWEFHPPVHAHLKPVCVSAKKQKKRQERERVCLEISASEERMDGGERNQDRNGRKEEKRSSAAAERKERPPPSMNAESASAQRSP